MIATSMNEDDDIEKIDHTIAIPAIGSASSATQEIATATHDGTTTKTANTAVVVMTAATGKISIATVASAMITGENVMKEEKEKETIGAEKTPERKGGQKRKLGVRRWGRWGLVVRR